MSDVIYKQNVALSKRRLWAGSLLSLLTSAGYYGAYAYVIYRTVTGDLSVGTMTFLAGAIAGASTNIQSIFATFSSIADQALFLSDLLQFFAVRPKVRSNRERCPPPSIRKAASSERSLANRGLAAGADSLIRIEPDRECSHRRERPG